MMQLATIDGGQPWCSTVYYVTDEDYNLYWASLPSRRHSQEIAKHTKCAAAIPVAYTKGRPAAGLQIQGSAEVVEDPASIRLIAEQYAAKFNRDNQWVNDFAACKTDHKLYKLTPSLYVLFDEVNFPENARQEFSRLYNKAL